MHDCFTRELKDGARPIDMDPAVLVSPCDAIVGASGRVSDGQVFQIKGFPYALSDLLVDADHAQSFRDGCYATLRLTSSMYHRFHAPYDCRVECGHAYLRRHLECQPDRAEAGRTVVLQK